MTTMSVEDILAELASASRGDEGMTTGEWADHMKCSELTARRRIKLLLLAKKMVHGKAPRTSVMDGRVAVVSVYRLI